ncbi:PREDICTED: cocaine- and amphetamine-regulated transcript protein [Crocodylus porosus]|uniref:cocaine- and amphetamine-regulated transcript protein n=1 Tax=Crocodylus porosus TaxID=8502 RepID=UPI0009400C4C|nr:PREDICTED: cocaine- and amphetamine-regulated transcript protein [Crocodylus porosus]
MEQGHLDPADGAGSRAGAGLSSPLPAVRLQIVALQEVLEKLKSKRLPSVEKKLGWVPSCDAGEQCAVRKGARIGKLCNCPRGTACNFYILKCL